MAHAPVRRWDPQGELSGLARMTRGASTPPLFLASVPGNAQNAAVLARSRPPADAGSRDRSRNARSGSRGACLRGDAIARHDPPRRLLLPQLDGWFSNGGMSKAVVSVGRRMRPQRAYTGHAGGVAPSMSGGPRAGIRHRWSAGRRGSCAPRWQATVSWGGADRRRARARLGRMAGVRRFRGAMPGESGEQGVGSSSGQLTLPRGRARCACSRARSCLCLRLSRVRRAGRGRVLHGLW